MVDPRGRRDRGSDAEGLRDLRLRLRADRPSLRFRREPPGRERALTARQRVVRVAGPVEQPASSTPTTAALPRSRTLLRRRFRGMAVSGAGRPGLRGRSDRESMVIRPKVAAGPSGSAALSRILRASALPAARPRPFLSRWLSPGRSCATLNPATTQPAPTSGRLRPRQAVTGVRNRTLAKGVESGNDSGSRNRNGGHGAVSADSAVRKAAAVDLIPRPAVVTRTGRSRRRGTPGWDVEVRRGWLHLQSARHRRGPRRHVRAVPARCPSGRHRPTRTSPAAPDPAHARLAPRRRHRCRHPSADRRDARRQ